MTKTSTEEFLRGRRAVPLPEWADHVGLPYTTVRERHRRGVPDVAVEQARPAADGIRGSGVMVPAREVRRYDAERFAGLSQLAPVA